ncbi:MAG: hypothetical protein RIR68_1323, partial [Pseudomonadota bacterium]
MAIHLHHFHKLPSQRDHDGTQQYGEQGWEDTKDQGNQQFDGEFGCGLLGAQATLGAQGVC